jgi:hypothetical protein
MVLRLLFEKINMLESTKRAKDASASTGEAAPTNTETPAIQTHMTVGGPFGLVADVPSGVQEPEYRAEQQLDVRAGRAPLTAPTGSAAAAKTPDATLATSPVSPVFDPTSVTEEDVTQIARSLAEAAKERIRLHQQLQRRASTRRQALVSEDAHKEQHLSTGETPGAAATNKDEQLTTAAAHVPLAVTRKLAPLSLHAGGTVVRAASYRLGGPKGVR